MVEVCVAFAGVVIQKARREVLAKRDDLELKDPLFLAGQRPESRTPDVVS